MGINSIKEHCLDKQRVKEAINNLKIILCFDQDTRKFALDNGFNNQNITNDCYIQEKIEELIEELNLGDEE